jgi:hypothetical protein
MLRTEFGIYPVFRGLRGVLQVQSPIAFPTKQDALRAGEVFADVLGALWPIPALRIAKPARLSMALSSRASAIWRTNTNDAAL